MADRQLTRKQKAVLKDILLDYLSDKHEVLCDARNYDLSRNDAWALHTSMANTALILEQVLGAKNVIEDYMWSSEDVAALCKDLRK